MPRIYTFQAIKARKQVRGQNLDKAQVEVASFWGNLISHNTGIYEQSQFIMAKAVFQE